MAGTIEAETSDQTERSHGSHRQACCNRKLGLITLTQWHWQLPRLAKTSCTPGLEQWTHRKVHNKCSEAPVQNIFMQSICQLRKNETVDAKRLRRIMMSQDS